MKKLKTFEDFEFDEEYIQDEYEDQEIKYEIIKQHISDEYGIDGVSDSDIDEWIVVLKERGEDPSEMTAIEIAESMYEDYEERVEKDWEE